MAAPRSIGRLAAMPFCLYLLASGTGTLHARLPLVKWALIVVLFSFYFVANLSMAVPGIWMRPWAAFWLSLVVYILIWFAIYGEVRAARQSARATCAPACSARRPTGRRRPTRRC